LDITAKIARLEALFDAFRAGKPRPEKIAAWFSASALVSAQGQAASLVEAAAARHLGIRDMVGRHAAPTGSLRWIYAALMTHNGVPLERFTAARDALRAARKASKTGSLHGGGSRAALVLCLASDTDTPVERFFEMKRAINPPWWRANPAVTDTFAAFHAARGDDPRSVVQARERARSVFKESRRARGHQIEGARLCALMAAEPRTVLRRFEALEAAKKDHKSIRWRVDRSMLMEWAAQGLEPSDMGEIANIRERLPKSISTTASARTRLAHLLLIDGRDVPEGGELAAMAAVIAAQTAMIVAATTATTVATTSS
jgi:hypothetical protein